MRAWLTTASLALGVALAHPAAPARADTPTAASRAGTARGSSISRELIQREVHRSRRRIRRCYELLLTRSPDARGTVVVEFVIGPAGDVKRARIVRADLSDQATLDCVLAVARRWRFPPNDRGAVTVRYPFVFRTGD